MEPKPVANRHVTKRDGRLEGEPNVEPSPVVKENQRDLTSLSGPEPLNDSREKDP